jgi:hypothetical protein
MSTNLTSVHTGYWINWSMVSVVQSNFSADNYSGNGSKVSRATITLPSHQRDFLIAFLALFVYWAGI